jgi:hypothetical protein
MNIGYSNKPIYDNCRYSMRMAESTGPFNYAMYGGKYENSQKCIYDKFYMKPDLVDEESELLGLNRPLSKCIAFQYNPNCPKSPMCTSTFDPSNPVVPSASICPIVFNNIPRQHRSGIEMPNPDFCHDF